MMATDSSKQSASSGSTSAKDAAKEVVSEARGTAKELGREAMDEARSTLGYVQEQARISVDDGKDQVATQISGLAQAFRKSSDELRHQEMGRLADQSEWLAERIDGLHRYLADRDSTELLDDLRSVARRRPGLFLGGMAALGFAAARFLHSSDASSGSGYQSRSARTHFDRETAEQS